MEPSRRGAANACRVVERPLLRPGDPRPRRKHRGRMTLVEFRNVSFAYQVSEGTRPFALRDMSFEIAPGESIGVTGPNSTGKTTLLSLLPGERQRAVIARALAQEPRLLVLDEPTAHLDLRYQVEAAALLRRLNRERGTTVLLVSHDLNLAAEVCDRLLLLNGGRAAAIGAPE